MKRKTSKTTDSKRTDTMNEKTKTKNSQNKRLPTVEEVCSSFGLNDVKISYTAADYQNLKTYKSFCSHVRPILAKKNPKVCQVPIGRLMIVKWSDFCNQRSKHAKTTGSAPKPTNAKVPKKSGDDTDESSATNVKPKATIGKKKKKKNNKNKAASNSDGGDQDSNNKTKTNNSQNKLLPTIKKVCSFFRLKDVKISFTEADYQNLNYKSFCSLVQPILAKENPTVPIRIMMMLISAKWRDFSNQRPKHAEKRGSFKVPSKDAEDTNESSASNVKPKATIEIGKKKTTKKKKTKKNIKAASNSHGGEDSNKQEHDLKDRKNKKKRKIKTSLKIENKECKKQKVADHEDENGTAQSDSEKPQKFTATAIERLSMNYILALKQAVSNFGFILKISNLNLRTIDENQESLLIETSLKAREAFQKKKLQESYELYSIALELDTDSKNHANRSKILYNRAFVSFELRNFESCIKDSSNALKLNNKYCKVLLLRGRSYMELKEYEKAVMDFQQAYIIEKKESIKSMLDVAKSFRCRSAAGKRKEYYDILPDEIENRKRIRGM